MSRKNRNPEEKVRREKIRELLQMANIGSMDDIQNLFKETIAEFMENGLEAELDDELGYSKYDYCNTFRRNSPSKPFCRPTRFLLRSPFAPCSLYKFTHFSIGVQDTQNFSDASLRVCPSSTY